MTFNFLVCQLQYLYPTNRESIICRNAGSDDSDENHGRDGEFHDDNGLSEHIDERSKSILMTFKSIGVRLANDER